MAKRIRSTSTTIRMTKEAHELLIAIADHYGYSQADIIHTLIEDKAKELKMVDSDHSVQ